MVLPGELVIRSHACLHAIACMHVCKQLLCPALWHADSRGNEVPAVMAIVLPGNFVTKGPHGGAEKGVIRHSSCACKGMRARPGPHLEPAVTAMVLPGELVTKGPRRAEKKGVVQQVLMTGTGGRTW